MKPELKIAMFRAAGLLSLFVVISVALLIAINAFTQPKIQQAQQASLTQLLNQVMPASQYDNNLLEDTKTVTEPEYLGSTEPMTIYRARLNGEPAGLVVETVAPNGYNGNIRLIVGVFADGRVAGVRVISHRETPGLGDKIELRKDDWILSFNGKTLTENNVNRWAVKRDRGEFDQFTGATITPRAVVGAVKLTLDYVNRHKQDLYE